jgi:colanic acid/amylovoran biosynthesis glycosyltransferase
MNLIPTTQSPYKENTRSRDELKPRIAYLLSQYPAISHTFFLKEILGLEQLGFQIKTSSINLPDRPVTVLTPSEAEASRSTYYIKAANYWEAIKTLASVLSRHPRVYLRGIRAALQLGTWNVYRQLYSFLYLLEALLLGAWMEKHQLHHLHVHFGGPVSTVGMLTAQAWNYSYSLTIHGPEEFYDVDLFHLPQKFRDAKFIFCISNFCRSQVMKYSPPSQWDNIHVLPLGVDTNQFAPMPRKSGTTVQLISVGRLVPAKGQLVLLQALGSLVNRGLTFHLTLIGDGSDKKLLKQFVASHHLDHLVTFRGALNHDETRAQLALSDIFVLPSFAEGVPVALMEAMAMEIPCVSTQIAGIPELIRNETDGILVPASSVDALADALQRLIEDEGLRRRFGSSARNRVIEHYNLTRNVQKLATAFEQCLAKRTSDR